jgi:hypothetical protein|tara:strand:- start:112 stop:327 length:216 start_codon:yes stop_codon:yes gene_type:complete
MYEIMHCPIPDLLASSACVNPVSVLSCFKTVLKLELASYREYIFFTPPLPHTLTKYPGFEEKHASLGRIYS